MKFFERNLFLICAVFMVLSMPNINFAQQIRYEFVPGNVYLFTDYYHNLDIKNLQLNQAPKKDTFMLSVTSFDIDLKAETLKVTVQDIATLPLSASPLSLVPPTLVTINLNDWQTVAFVEIEIVIDNTGGLRRVTNKGAYLTVYGRIPHPYHQPGKSPYKIFVLQEKLN